MKFEIRANREATVVLRKSVKESVAIHIYQRLALKLTRTGRKLRVGRGYYLEVSLVSYYLLART
jgi:hypothetical protein